jgi:hypothetical protein
MDRKVSLTFRGSIILSIPSRLFLCQNSLNTPDLPVRQPYLDPMRVVGRVGQQVFYGADGFAAGSLVLLEDDRDAETRADI